MARINNKRRPWQPKLKRQRGRPRPNKYKKFYDSRAWKRLRDYHIQRHPLCVKCKQQGKIKGADHVDHIKPISRGGNKLDANNLQSLCLSCHSIKTAKERQE